MYRKYYGLIQKPFELAPVGGRVYLSESHREALATLRYGVIANKGFLLLTGGVGTGKTTVLNTLLGMVRDKIKVCVLNNPTLSKHEFFSYLSGSLGIPYKKNKGDFILDFASFLKNYEEEGGKVLLIIDEAQAFPINLLEEIRLLSNHAGEKNALSIFLIGQPELQEKLADPLLLPLRQRIGIRHHLEPLTEQDTAQYIVYRLNKAGAVNSALFDSGATNLIHKESRGNPRLINIICDHALISGFNQDLNHIDKTIIEDCIKEIKLAGEKRLQASDTNKSPQSNRKLFGKDSNISILTATILILFVLSVTGLILYEFVPEQWWQRIVELTSPILDTFK
ncbi:ExeA family protein [Desulforhopalus sp. IMCC35007]|uniref:ExeA family protein n=1 Tax=Desulforhopalus sp. IMCC35007 TaxID=2569543 RepID=UPI0010AEBB62|nr:AAA family ATPase [Desulforhopalus sp. IMCC35007]TKB12076.1 AAA family ATPase [Desulforhopalus sp. IMCC35007]